MPTPGLQMRYGIVMLMLLSGSSYAGACEPVVPFLRAVVPITLVGSLTMLALAVVAKSVLFALFERRISPVRAASTMFVGNLLTSVIGFLVAAMIATAPVFWIIGVPLALLFCWLPTRRLVAVSPFPWLQGATPIGISIIMTIALFASCILFAGGRAIIDGHQLAVYWAVKLVAISLALFASMTLTTIWEEWVVWRFSNRPAGTGFYVSVLRTNLYVLVFILAMPAIVTFRERMKSPDFLVIRAHATIAQAVTR